MMSCTEPGLKGVGTIANLAAALSESLSPPPSIAMELAEARRGSCSASFDSSAARELEKYVSLVRLQCFLFVSACRQI